MNNIMKFENCNVQIIQDETGNPLFELYSTGMALGYVVKNHIGRLYPNKKRIDTIMKNAEITGCLHDVNTYINESQLYDFMLEARTAKCKSFRKWVTSEVLPTIRRTGTYSTVQQGYEFRPKTYRGQAVVTIDDLAFLSGVNRHNIFYYIKKLIKNTDYFLLEGEELAAYKRENNFVSRMIGTLTVITKSGFLKLGKLLTGIPKQLECFKAELQVKNTFYKLAKGNEQYEIKSIREVMSGINSLLDIFASRVGTRETFGVYFQDLMSYEMQMNSLINSLKEEKIFISSR